MKDLLLQSCKFENQYLLVYYRVHDCLWFCLVAIVCLSIESTDTARLKIYNKQYHDQTILVFDQYMHWHISLFTLVWGFFRSNFVRSVDWWSSTGGMSQIWLDVTSKVIFFWDPLLFYQPPWTQCPNKTTSDFSPSKYRGLCKKFLQKTLCVFHTQFFLVLSCENLLERTSLMGVRIWLKHFIDTIQGSRYCTYQLVDIWKPYPKSKRVSF
jgi:hypothetical protein